jgi:hypothetical protein
MNRPNRISVVWATAVDYDMRVQRAHFVQWDRSAETRPGN